MMRFYFKRGLRYRALQEVWELRRRLATGKLQFENEQGEIKVLSDAEVLSLWHKGEWVVDESSLGIQADAIYLATPRDLSTFPEKWQKRALNRLYYINAVKPDQIKFNPEVWNKLIKTAAEEINDPKPPAANTVHNWWVKYRVTKSVTKLIPKNIEGFQRPRDYRYAIFEEGGCPRFCVNGG